MIDFLYPRYLAFLFLVPTIILIHFLALHIKKSQALKFANFEAIAKIRGIDLFSKNITVLIIGLLIISFISFSLAGMTYKTSAISADSSFVIAIDSSQSMSAADLAPNRMVVAKSTSRDFVNSMPFGTRMGVISFSGNSIINQEVTESRELVLQGIAGIEISAIGGTDLYDALIASANLLRNEKTKSIILLSDGQVNIGDLDKAIKYCSENNIVVHTIVIGTLGGGQTSYGLSKADMDSLKSIAFGTGGEFFSATDESGLADSFEKIKGAKIGTVNYSLSTYLLMATALLFVIEYILINTRYRLVP